MADLKRWSRDEISRMRRDMDRMFDDLCTDFNLPLMLCRMTGDLELVEEKGVLVARMALGTMNPDTVRVTAHDRRLIIEAQSIVEEGHRREARSFSKEIRLPCRIQANGVEMRFVNGILEVRLPKCRPEIGRLVHLLKR